MENVSVLILRNCHWVMGDTGQCPNLPFPDIVSLIHRKGLYVNDNFALKSVSGGKKHKGVSWEVPIINTLKEFHSPQHDFCVLKIEKYR